jgi:hypothetical protein
MALLQALIKKGILDKGKIAGIEEERKKTGKTEEEVILER